MIALIINPVAGGAGRRGAASRLQAARAALASCGEETDVQVSEGRGHVRDLAIAARHAGARLLMVWGGDGSVNEAGSAVMGSSVPLAIVPAGSGNGLARDLGIPLEPRAAIAAALRGRPRVIDAGELGGRPFFNVAGVGIDAQIAARFAGRRGFATYVRLSMRELLTYKPRSYRIDCGEHGDLGADAGRRALLQARRALLVTIANSSQFGNGARIAPNARLDDGRLDLVVFEEPSRVATMCAVPRLFAGGLDRVRGFTTRQIETARITSDVPMTFHVDGEPVAGGPVLDVRVLPKALQVIG